MKEITLPPNHIEDSHGLLAEAASQTYAVDKQLYIPERPAVPRPDFDNFELGIAASEAAMAPDYQNGRYIVNPAQSDLVRHFGGLRGFAAVRSQGRHGVRTITAPAILLADGQRLALLTAEAPTGTISHTQHALLESEYVKDSARVTGRHSSNDVTNVGEIGPSLVVASSGLSGNAHNDLHGLAGNRQRTFGGNFSADGRQDIQLGHDVRAVRSTVIDIGRALFITGKQDQLRPGESLFGLGLSAGELAVGMTLAASQSRGLPIDLAANLERMSGQ